MGWQINLVANDLKLSKACAKELDPVLDDLGFDPTNKNRLQFCSDHMEHMDYLSNEPEILEILKRHNVTGAVRFVDGEQGQCMWEHRFDHGEYTRADIDLCDVEF